MEIENIDAAATKEEKEEATAMQCPFKRMKMDGEIASFRSEALVSVTSLENPNDSSSNGGDDGEKLQADTSNDFADDAGEGDSENDGSDSENGYGSEDNYEEIESLLDQALPEELKNKKKDYEERFKIIMEEKGRNHFEVLPEGWVQVTHDSGMPLYLHRHSRVCSLSRPYFLGPGSVRKHEIPISSIPCLNYQKALEKEKEQIEEQKQMFKEQQEKEATAAAMEVDEESSSKLSNGLSAMLNLNKPNATHSLKAHLPPIPNAKVETVSENLRAHSLSSLQFTDYCKKRFNFKTIRVMRFKSWSARRKFTKNRKHIKHLQRPTLPDGTKLITFKSAEVQDPSSTTPSSQQRPKKEWVMNPNGKSFVCILHEYVQHAWKKQPSYEFKELENSATPYSATVSINNLKYGTGYGTSKKQAKSEAARETLEVLIPEMREKISGLEKTPGASVGSGVTNKAQPQDLSVFDEIRIEDPRVPEFCQKTTEPSPHSILLTCLQRNYGLGTIQVKYDVNTAKHKKNEFTMTVGAHTTKVYCKNKRDGKQRASQAILQILHPQITTWGSLLRLYGNRSVKSFKEKKQEEQEITILQNQAAVNQPNYAILNKLKTEMSKLKEMRANIESSSKTATKSLASTNISTISNIF